MKTRREPVGERSEAGGKRRAIRGYAEVPGPDRSDLAGQIADQRRRLADRLQDVGAIVAVVSGKGGVGKSAVTANLAVSLAARGAQVGVVDADLNGPCLAGMLGFPRHAVREGADGIVPAVGRSGVKGISSELLVDERSPLRWKGPAPDRFVWQGATETAMLREFLSDVAWGALDYLLVDVPPGTDKIGRFLDLIPRPDQLLLVTIPSAAATSVVARSATFLVEAGLETMGVVRNMVAYVPAAGAAALPLFRRDDSGAAEDPLGLEVWAEIPFDPLLSELTDRGDPPGAGGVGAVGAAFRTLTDRVVSRRAGRAGPAA
jgi:ATP-binding protein involved in chromosome partitioning